MMTPEELAEAMRLYQQKQQAEAAQAQQAHMQTARRRQIYTGLGALAGAGVGYALLKLLDKDRGKARAAEMVEGLGGQCERIAHDKIAQLAGELGIDIPQADHETPTFGGHSTVRDAEFEVLDDDET